jgi:hypothetical protein
MDVNATLLLEVASVDGEHVNHGLPVEEPVIGTSTGSNMLQEVTITGRKCNSQYLLELDYLEG